MASLGFQLGALAWILLVFVSAAFFTRASHRRIVGSLVGGLASGFAAIVVDIAAHNQGWWNYRNVQTPYGPPLYYVASGIGFGALALVAWRLMRRFGWRGLLGESLALMVYGPPRDYLLADLPGLMDFRWSATIAVMDALLVWTIPFMIAFVSMRFVAGPAGDDLLVRNPLTQRT